MRKRNNRIVFYLNDEELAALTDKVQKSKFPREKFIRITLANKRITEMPPVDYGRLVFEMRRAGQNLHRLLVIATAIFCAGNRTERAERAERKAARHGSRTEPADHS